MTDPFAKRAAAFAVALVLSSASPGLTAGDPLAAWRSSVPVPVLPGLVNTEAKEFALSLTPSGDRLFFTRQSQGEKGEHEVIYESRFANGSWQPATVVAFSGTWDDADPFVSPDGRWLYFMSTRPTEGPTEGKAERTDFELWRVPLAGDGFGKPEWLSTVGSLEGDSYPTVGRSGELVFASRRAGGLGGNDLWSAMPNKDGFAPPSWLGAAINSAGSDGNPLLAPDGSWLIFFSTRNGGAPELFLARRLAEGGFGAPLPLCPAVNTSAVEIAPGLSPDGKILFFSREGEILAVELTACLPAG